MDEGRERESVCVCMCVFSSVKSCREDGWPPCRTPFGIHMMQNPAWRENSLSAENLRESWWAFPWSPKASALFPFFAHPWIVFFFLIRIPADCCEACLNFYSAFCVSQFYLEIFLTFSISCFKVRGELSLPTPPYRCICCFALGRNRIHP